MSVTGKLLVLYIVVKRKAGGRDLSSFVCQFRVPLFLVLSNYFLGGIRSIGACTGVETIHLLIPCLVCVAVSFLFFGRLRGLGQVVRCLCKKEFVGNIC